MRPFFLNKTDNFDDICIKFERVNLNNIFNMEKFLYGHIVTSSGIMWHHTWDFSFEKSAFFRHFACIWNILAYPSSRCHSKPVMKNNPQPSGTYASTERMICLIIDKRHKKASFHRLRETDLIKGHWKWSSGTGRLCPGRSKGEECFLWLKILHSKMSVLL